MKLAVGEPTPGLDWNQRLLGAHFQLLNGPTVAIWIVETEEGAAIALVKDGDFASFDATSQQLVARRSGIGDDKLQSFHRPRCHCPLRRQVAEDDRASRPGWGQLHDVHELVASVVIEMEANLISVKGDRAVDVADRQMTTSSDQSMRGHYLLGAMSDCGRSVRPATTATTGGETTAETAKMKPITTPTRRTESSMAAGEWAVT